MENCSHLFLRISDYLVLDKWLKDRKERRLTLDETKNYCRVVTAIIKTADIQKELENAYLEAKKEECGLAWWFNFY